MMKREEIEKTFEKAIADRARYVGMEFRVNDDNVEIIIIPAESFEKRLNIYHKKEHAEQYFEHIAKVAAGDTFADIEYILLNGYPDWKRVIAGAIDKVVARMLEGHLDVSKEQMEAWEIVFEGYKEQFYSNRYTIAQQRFIVENEKLYEDMFETCMNGTGEEFKKKFINLSKELNKHA